MKTKILYTTSAMVLALMAGRVQAETKIAPYSVVHPQVDFVSTFGLEKGSELRFGVVVNPEVGQTITITPNNQISSSYSGNATKNATLLGVGMIDSEKAINVSTVSRGSVTVSGHIGTLNKAGTVKLLFPTEAVTLSDGGTTCGSVVINPALDGENGVVTGRQSGENPGLYYYGGTLTLSTNATGKHCVGNGNVTLVFDDSSVQDPDQFNDEVDDFSLIPPESETTLPEYLIQGTLVSFSEYTNAISNIVRNGEHYGEGDAYGEIVPVAGIENVAAVFLIRQVPSEETRDQRAQARIDFAQSVLSGEKTANIIVFGNSAFLGSGHLSGNTMSLAPFDTQINHDVEYYKEYMSVDSTTCTTDTGAYNQGSVTVFNYNIDLNAGAYQLTGYETVDTQTFLQEHGLTTNMMTLGWD